METEIAVLLHLAGNGVSVSTPIARRDKQALTSLDCAEGERWAVLFTAAPGTEVNYTDNTEDLAALYGRAAAAIHGAADSFEGPRLRARLDLQLLLERPAAIIASVASHRPTDLAYLAELGDRLRSRVDSEAKLQIGFCHGDLHGQNACYWDGTFTFYDFDCCGWGYRAYDAAVFPWAFAIGGCAPERIQAMGRAFLGGYLQSRPLGPADIAAVPVFVAIRQIWLMGLQIELADRFGWSLVGDNYLDWQLKVLRDWETNFLDRPAAEWLLPS